MNDEADVKNAKRRNPCAKIAAFCAGFPVAVMAG
jgi:hypothetical protein